ncbi:MAG: glycoside hydrolase family 16 protein [Flavobacteriaceae bacterium]
MDTKKIVGIKYPLKKINFIYLLYAIFLVSLISCTSSEENTDNQPPEVQGLELNEQDKIGLIWSEEFNTNSLNTAIWSYDLGDGSEFGIPGWGNQELQTYTSASKNLTIANGFLTITAIKENRDGKSYTSARIKSQNKFSFKHGQLKVRAKFPQSKGTWPAIWLMGNNLDQVGWPNCGEIDLVEQNGQQKDQILGTIHWKNTADNTNAKFTDNITSANIGTDFKEYRLIWNENTIKMYVENVKYFDINLNESMPFNQEFFLLLNLAMGGSLGGDIATNFSQDSLVIDYIRLYEN